MSVLVLWEFSRKQDYIFRSNKLIECVGASFIIKDLSENFSDYNLEEESFIIKGGGKTIYLFQQEKEAEKFIADFSVHVLKRYPGLELFMVKQNFNIKEEDIKQSIKSIYKKLEKKKSSRIYAGNQLGFGIEKECISTKYPATGFYNEDGEKKYISSEIKIKRCKGKDNQKDYFSDIIPKDYKFDRYLDQLVNKDAKNYIAVIHIDGNDMGKKIKSLEERVVKKSSETNEEFNIRYIKILKNFSEEINERYKNAFEKMSKVIVENETDLNEVTQISQNILPIRPLILAGDDVTYISNGYISVESARVFLEELDKYNIIIDGIKLGRLDACAGVAIVKKEYPFIKAYELAEQLCQNSKAMLLERKYDGISAIDFHIAQGDTWKSIYQIREEEYKLDNGKINLTMRPLVLSENEDWRNYKNFLESIKNIESSMKGKNGKKGVGRNKIKALKDALKKGKATTELFFKFYKIPTSIYFKSLDGTFGDYCFNEIDNTCMYLDAIEIMDLFVRLHS